MKKMTKVRLSIIGFIALLSTGIVLLWANWHPQKWVPNSDSVFVENIGGKLSVVVPIVVILLIPAIILFFATFFAFNEKGQVPRDSWIADLFSTTRETKNEDGTVAVVKEVPDEIRFCPTYWRLVFVVTAFSSFATAAAGVLIGLPWTIYEELTDGKPVSRGLEGLMPTWEDWPIFAGILGLIGGVFLVVWLGTLLVKVWPRLRKTLIGRLVAAVYNKACVKLEVEPVSASE